MTQEEFLSKMSDLISEFESTNDVIVGAYLDLRTDATEIFNAKLTHESELTHEWSGLSFMERKNLKVIAGIVDE